MMTNVHIFKHKTFYERNEVTITTYSVAFANTVAEPDAIEQILAHFNNSERFISSEYISSFNVLFIQQLYTQLRKLTYYSNNDMLLHTKNIFIDIITDIYPDVFKRIENIILPLMSYEKPNLNLVALSKDEDLKKVTINSVRVLECLATEAWLANLDKLPIEINVEEYYEKYIIQELFFVYKQKNNLNWSRITGETEEYSEIITSNMNLQHPLNNNFTNIQEVVGVFNGNVNADFTFTKLSK